MSRRPSLGPPGQTCSTNLRRRLAFHATPSRRPGGSVGARRSSRAVSLACRLLHDVRGTTKRAPSTSLRARRSATASKADLPAVPGPDSDLGGLLHGWPAEAGRTGLDIARPGRDLGAPRCPELGEDVLDVAARGLGCDVERLRDLAVGHPFADQSCDLELPRGERAPRFIVRGMAACHPEYSFRAVGKRRRFEFL